MKGVNDHFISLTENPNSIGRAYEVSFEKNSRIMNVKEKSKTESFLSKSIFSSKSKAISNSSRFNAKSQVCYLLHIKRQELNYYFSSHPSSLEKKIQIITKIEVISIINRNRKHYFRPE